MVLVRPSTTFYFVLTVLVWGSSFFLIKVAVGGISPFQVALGRGVLGAATLACVMLATRTPWPSSPALWGRIGIVSLTQCVIPWLLVPFAEQYVPSSFAGITNATTTIWAIILTPILIRSESLKPLQVAGFFVGLAGVVVVLAPWRFLAELDLRSQLPADLALLGAAASFGFSLVYLRRSVRAENSSALTLASMQTSMAAGILIVLTPFFGLQPIRLDWQVVLCMLGLGVVSTGFGFLWNTEVVRSWGAASAASASYLMPIIGVVLGIVLLGEHLEWWETVGGVIILLGLLTSRWRGRTRPDAPILARE
jgi:drug/metabolite transporter (DMT)-like permease